MIPNYPQGFIGSVSSTALSSEESKSVEVKEFQQTKEKPTSEYKQLSDEIKRLEKTLNKIQSGKTSASSKTEEMIQQRINNLIEARDNLKKKGLATYTEKVPQQPKEATVKDVVVTESGLQSKASFLQTKEEREATNVYASKLISTSEGVKYGSVSTRTNNRINPYDSITSMGSKEGVQSNVQKVPQSTVKTTKEVFGEPTLYSRIIRKQSEAQEQARLNPTQAGGYNIKGYFYGAVSVPVLIFTQPKEFAKGTFYSITHPIESVKGIGESLRTQPEFFIGEQIGTFGTFKGIGYATGKITPYAKPYLVGDTQGYIRGTEQFMKYGFESKTKQFQPKEFNSVIGNEFKLSSGEDLGQVSLRTGTVTRSIGVPDFRLKQPEYFEFRVEGVQSRLNQFTPKPRVEFPKATGEEFFVKTTKEGQMTLGGRYALDSLKKDEPIIVKDVFESTQQKIVPTKILDINERGEIKVTEGIKLKPLEKGETPESTSLRSTQYYSELPSSNKVDTLSEGVGSKEAIFKDLDFTGKNFKKQLSQYNQELILIEEPVRVGRTISPVERTNIETVRIPIRQELSVTEPALASNLEKPILISNTKTLIGNLNIMGTTPIQIQQPIQQTRQTPIQIQQPIQQLKPQQIQEQVYEQKLRQVNQQRQELKSEELLSTQQTYNLPKFSTKEKDKKRKSKASLYVRKKGKFELKGSSEDIQSLFKRGKDIIENTAQASFKVVGESGKPILPGILPSRFTTSKKDKGILVQKREFRISSAGEKREIPGKAQQLRRLI